MRFDCNTCPRREYSTFIHVEKLEPTYVCVTDTREVPRMRNVSKVRDGVELTPTGEGGNDHDDDDRIVEVASVQQAIVRTWTGR